VEVSLLAKGTKKERKPVTAEKATQKLAAMLAPFSKQERKEIAKGANKILRLVSKLNG